MPILVDSHPGYRLITLNRAERLNALTVEMADALLAALGDAEADEACRALLLTEAHALAARLARGPTAAYALIKQAFAESAENDLDEQLDVERDLQEEAAESPDHAEGVRAFLDKRPPVFTGRKE